MFSSLKSSTYQKIICSLKACGHSDQTQSAIKMVGSQSLNLDNKETIFQWMPKRKKRTAVRQDFFWETIQLCVKEVKHKWEKESISVSFFYVHWLA